MRKNFESRIPKPILSKTDSGSVRINESWSSNREKKSHVQFNTESLNFAELRIKIVEEDSQSQPNKVTRGRSAVKYRVPGSSTRSNASSRSRRASKSPQTKHKIIVYEPEKSKATRVSSPYMCDFSHKEDPDAPAKEMYVSDREFKILRHAADVQEAAERKPPLSRFEKTLFGYVTLPEEPTASGVSKSSNSKQNQEQSSQYTKISSQMIVSRRLVDKKKSRSQKECSNKAQGQVSKSQSTEDNKSKKRRSRQNPSTSDNFTLTNAWDDDLLYSDSKMEEYRMFVEKFKERFNKPYADSISSPFYPSPPAAGPVEKLAEESQTEVNGNVDKTFSCDLIGQNMIDPSPKTPQEDTNDDISSKYSSSVLEAGSSQWETVCRSSSQRSLAENMTRSVMVATEASVVLMSTLFKGALRDPKSSARLVDSKLFQKFILVETEVEALENAATIFDAANKSILRYLQSLNRPSVDSSLLEVSNGFGNISEIPIVKSQVVQELSQVQEQTMLDAKQSLDSTDSRPIQDEAPGSSAALQFSLTSSEPQPIPKVSRCLEEPKKWTYNSDMDKKQLQMTMSTTHEPGFLVQNIICQDFEFHLNFVGNTRKVSSLVSSSRSKTKTIDLTPFQLVDIIDRCLTHLSLRLGSTNVHLQIISQRLGTIVKDYTDGKHGHYSKSLKRSNAKLQGLNNFAGIVGQMTKVVTKICEKLICSLNVLLKLNEILSDKDTGESTGEELAQIPSTQEPLVEVVTILDELESALEIGRNSLTAIYSKSPSDLKMKKCLREILDNLFRALLELETENYIDFGSLLMSAVSCTVKLCGCTGKPRFDHTVQNNIIINLNKMKINIMELQGTSKRMHFVSGYLASKSSLNLKNNREAAKILDEKHSQIKNIPWYKRRLFTRVLERTYSMISIPSPVNMVSDEEGDLHLNEAATPESSHYSTISAENESTPSSIHT